MALNGTLPHTLFSSCRFEFEFENLRILTAKLEVEAFAATFSAGTPGSYRPMFRLANRLLTELWVTGAKAIQSRLICRIWPATAAINRKTLDEFIFFDFTPRRCVSQSV